MEPRRPRTIYLRLQVPETVPSADHELIRRVVTMMEEEFSGGVTISMIEVQPNAPTLSAELPDEMTGLLRDLRSALPKREQWDQGQGRGGLDG